MTVPALSRQERPIERAFEDDPGWLIARATYLYPDADHPDMKMVQRIFAATEMRDIERRYEGPADAT